MSRPPSTLRNADGSTIGSDQRRQAAEAARRVAEQWERAEAADLPAAMETDPAIMEDRSVFFDLAQKEYRLHRDEWGDRTPSEYCERFPDLDEGLRHSLRRLIEVEQHLDEAALDQLLDEPEEIEWPVAGQMFGKYYVSRELGRGATGMAFLCRNSSLGDRACVLKISPSIGAEAATLGQLDHPNIVPVHDADTEPDSGLGWIRMPYLGGRTLQDAIAGAFVAGVPKTDLLKNPLPESRPTRARELHEGVALRLFADLASALHYVNENRMLHGDLKPSNVLLTDEGAAMLIDFNLARKVSNDNALLGGTLPYMAPEQLATIANEVGSHDLTSATDVFSFGVMMHQALTGKPPFGSRAPSKGVVANARGLLEAQTAWRAEGAPTLAAVDPTIARLVRRCLAESPADRPHSFRGLCDSLQRLRSPGRRWWRFAANRPKSAALAATLGVAIMAGVALAAPLAYEDRTLERAGRFAAEQRHEEAIALLQTYVADHPDSAAAHRTLGNSLLDSGDEAAAAGHFRQAWLAGDRPLDIAMVGYCKNLLGDYRAATAPYRTALDRRNAFCSVAHNLAASRLRVSGDSFDSEASQEVEKLLKEAWSLKPENETIRLTMLRHHGLLAARKRFSPGYPVEIAALPSDQTPSYEFCLNAAWFVARRAKDEQELREYGFPCLQRMVDLRGIDTLRRSLGGEAESVYEPLFGDLITNRSKRSEPPKPPFFLDPRNG